jgi:hypothetical protein
MGATMGAFTGILVGMSAALAASAKPSTAIAAASNACLFTDCLPNRKTNI